MRELLDQFGGSMPLAVAAYNAGPTRVQDWLASNGDPRTDATDMIDWIELIPFGETRNYVQRVIENLVIYRAQGGETVPVLQPQRLVAAPAPSPHPTLMPALARWVATFGGSGLVPGAPGTAGSLAALLPGLALLWLSPAPWRRPLSACWPPALGHSEGRRHRRPGLGGDRRGGGQWIALLPLAHPSVAGAVLAFAAFRLFDIAKPGPVGWAERLPGALGVMADDVLAGAAGGAGGLGARWAAPGLLD